MLCGAGPWLEIRWQIPAVSMSQVANTLAGFIDAVVDPGELEVHCMTVAENLAQLPQAQFAANKLSVRAGTLQAMKASLETLATR